MSTLDFILPFVIWYDAFQLAIILTWPFFSKYDEIVLFILSSAIEPFFYLDPSHRAYGFDGAESSFTVKLYVDTIITYIAILFLAFVIALSYLLHGHVNLVVLKVLTILNRS